MTSEHPTHTELEWYVSLGLDQALRGWPSERVSALERHVDTCEPCAAALAAEAQIELAVDAATRAPARHSSIGRWVGGAVAAATIAVALTVAAFPGRPGAASGHTGGPAIDAGVELAVDGDVLAD